MRDPLNVLPAQERQVIQARQQPSWVNPTLATLTDERFSDPAWLFEPKFDGERCLVFRDGSGVRLMSRNRKQVSDRYPELVDCLAGQEVDDFVADGEIVAFEHGVSSFAGCRRRCSSRSATAGPIRTTPSRT